MEHSKDEMMEGSGGDGGWARAFSKLFRLGRKRCFPVQQHYDTYVASVQRRKHCNHYHGFYLSSFAFFSPSLLSIICNFSLACDMLMLPSQDQSLGLCSTDQISFTLQRIMTISQVVCREFMPPGIVGLPIGNPPCALVVGLLSHH